ncbi:16S rRNA (adenine(1518)-N(6)/adenine(1519)-N(6))-dimethyltransferase RsmA [Paracoccaceae bacterium]|nr:16S rRNA (adenine(1518)-N(6)/adenine(1519)-N(6))-dimethyltransferase RsmA [Paracoccaceae bacterium]
MFFHKKKFGQNFITDQTVLYKILNIAGKLENKNVLEIGGGTGNLTKYLLHAKPKSLLVIEIDKECITSLERILNHKNQKTKLVHGNFLNIDISNYFTTPPVIFGNLPYNVSTKILTKLLMPANKKPFWDELLLMFQLEVAKRIVALPNTKEYGRLSLFAQFYSKPAIEMEISEESFFPRPKVRSALVRFKHCNDYMTNYDNDLFEKIIKKSFQERRKKIKNTLKSEHENILSILAKCNISGESRAENISIQQYCDLTKALEETI